MEPLRFHLNTLRRLSCDERAASSIEYALIAAGIAIVIVASVNSLGVSVKAMYDSVVTALG